MSTVYYTAASLDGFIATEEDSLDWLMALGDPEQSSYPQFIARIGALAMGTHTLAWVARELARTGEPWPYSQPTFVFTHRPLPVIPGAELVAVSGAVEPVHARMAQAAGGKDLWITGGGDLAAQFHRAGLLDELVVQVAPVLLGRGKPLFPHRLEGPLERLSVQCYGPLVEIRYRLPRVDTGNSPQESRA